MIIYRFVRDNKNLLGILDKGGQIRPRKKPRSNGTDGADQRKTLDAFVSDVAIISCTHCLCDAVHGMGQ